MADIEAGKQTAAAGRFAAGRRRRSAVRARRGARPPRRRGSRPRLSAARALSRAESSAGAAVARRSLRAGEEARPCDQESTSACRRTRRCSATPTSRRHSISTASTAPTRPRHLDKADRSEHPTDIEAIMALGNILRGRKEFAECARCLQQGRRHHRQARAAELADLLFPRHLLRALQAVAERPKPT